MPFFLADGPQLGRGDGAALQPLDLPQDYWIVLALPHGVTKPSTAAVYRHFDERDGSQGWEERRAALARALAEVRRPRDLAGLPANDLASSPLATELLRLGAFRADVSGAGPAVYGSSTTAATPMPPAARSVARAHLAHRPSGTGEDRSGYARGRGPSGDHRARDDALGRALRDNRLRIALLVALVEGILVLVGSIDWWVVVLLAVGAVVLYVSWGRAAPRQEVREGSWIFAVSQLAVALVPALALVLTAFAVVALVILAVVALVLLLATAASMSARALGRGQVVRQRVLVP